MRLARHCLSVLYWSAKWFGLTPFGYRQQVCCDAVGPCVCSFIYSMVFCAAICTLLPYLQFRHLMSLLGADGDRNRLLLQPYTLTSTLRLVLGVQLLVRTLRTCLGALLQVFNRQQLIGLSNEYIRIAAVSPKADAGTVRRGNWALLYKLATIGLQMLVIGLNGVMFDSQSASGDWTSAQNWTLLACQHGFAILSTAMYFAALFLLLQLYARVNAQIVRMGCGRWAPPEEVDVAGGGEPVEELSVLYARITRVLHTTVRLFAVQLALGLWMGFVHMLTGLFCVASEMIEMMGLEERTRVSEPRIRDMAGFVSAVTLAVFYALDVHSLLWITGQIESFLLQVLDMRPKITLWGLFAVDMPLMSTMIMSLTSYFAILLQFELSDVHQAALHAMHQNRTAQSTTLGM